MIQKNKELHLGVIEFFFMLKKGIFANNCFINAYKIRALIINLWQLNLLFSLEVLIKKSINK